MPGGRAIDPVVTVSALIAARNASGTARRAVRRPRPRRAGGRSAVPVGACSGSIAGSSDVPPQRPENGSAPAVRRALALHVAEGKGWHRGERDCLLEDWAPSVAGCLGELPAPPEYTQERAERPAIGRSPVASQARARYQETWTETVPLDSGASWRNASLYRSITRPLPHAHQSISFTLTQLPDPQTVTVRPRQSADAERRSGRRVHAARVVAVACAHARLAVPAGAAAHAVRRVRRRLRPGRRLQHGLRPNRLVRIGPRLERARLLLEVADL